MTKHTLKIMPAGPGDLAALDKLHPRSKSANAGRERSLILRKCLQNQSLLLAKTGGKTVGAAALDVDQGRLAEWLYARGWNQARWAEPLISDIERLAIQFGILELSVLSRPDTQAVLESLHYRRQICSASEIPGKPPLFRKSLSRRQTDYSRRVRAIHQALGIPANYGRAHRLPLQPECQNLASIGADLYGREQKMHPLAANAWMELKYASLNSGIKLQPVSAFRSVEYQQGLLQRKLNKGQPMREILRVSAAPGFSEHHTGRAIDITTPGSPVLEEEFEASQAFKWMKKHAVSYGFYLSFPRRNRHKLAYEPWHWCFRNNSMQ